MVSESKADDKYPVVSAASIVAKVTRDHCISEWKFDEPRESIDHEFGCGYPSDPKTRSWLDAQFDPEFGYPRIVRFSWKTTKDRLEA
jgi:ribonuclease H2 subunit A